ARIPSIAGTLARNGARLLVNSTAWVVSQPPPVGTNPQAEFLWRVRALENRCAAVAASEAGPEAGGVQDSGRSQTVAADGAVVAIAPAPPPELLAARGDLP